MRVLSRLGFLAAVGLAACIDAPVARNNPLDRGAPLDARIVGIPDTFNSRGELHRFALETTPALPPGTRVTWRAEGFLIYGDTLLASTARASLTVGVLEATIGDVAEPRVVRRQVTHRQRPFRVDTTCTDCELGWFGAPFAFAPGLRDSLGSLLIAPVGLTVDLTFRDSTLLTRDLFTGGWRAAANGETWIVAQARGLPQIVDSVRLRVWQRHHSIQPLCPVLQVVGDTATAGVDFYRDGASNRVTHAGPHPDVIWVAGIIEDGPDPNPGLAVTPAGFATALRDGFYYLEAAFASDPTRAVARCAVDVRPLE